MATTPLPLLQAKLLENVVTLQYTAVNARAQIAAAIFTNQTTANATVTVHIVVASGTPIPANRIIFSKTIAPNETWKSPELSGQILASGDSIHAFSDTASAITMRMSGFETT